MNLTQLILWAGTLFIGQNNAICKMKKHTIYLLSAVGISVIKNIKVPAKYNVMVGVSSTKQELNDLIYFLGIDLVIVFLMLAICSLGKNDKVFSIIANAALFLAIGKTVDEVGIAPYGYHIAEFIFDTLIVLIAARRYFIFKRNSTTIR